MSIPRKILSRVVPGLLLDIAASVRSYRQTHGAFPNLFQPRNFNEKIVARSLFDNQPILRRFADKYAVRAFVAKRLGENALPRLLHVTQNPKDIPFSKLPDAFVIKPTHGSGWVRTVRDKEKLDRDELIGECEYWLSQNFYKVHRERIYKDVTPRILVEELIDDGCPGGPIDYKFLVFHGKVHVIMVIADRFTKLRAKLYDSDWNMLDAGFIENGGSTRNDPGHFQRPPHLAEMVQAAERLADGIDFIRVDFYDTPKKWFFGELTSTPAAGQELFDPPEFNDILGKLW